MGMRKEKIWITPPLPGGVKIRHVGLLDLPEFYTWLQRWFEFNSFFKADADFEQFYEERTLPKGKEMHIRWKGKKDETEYFHYYIEVIWLLIGVNKIEIPVGDKKRKIDQGDFELRLGAYIEKEGPDNIFRRIYEYFVIRKIIEDHKYKLYDKFYSLHDEIKAYFDQYVK
ncbi:hypothetical protein FJZ53_00395 [Candidatus Woesearchaeota archaeon]|nr:hypothetical protein [Candidatus Woesearchaeota archaeon]